VASTIRGLEFFGGVPEVIVPDQLRSAVTGPDRYEPDINATYLEMAQHYGTAIVPARPYHPRDKAKVEAAVLLVQRWILACLRHERFTTLDALNERIAELLAQLNQRPFAKMSGSRQELFVKLDRPALRPLPKLRYELAIRKWAKVNIDYHISFEDRHYSVPCALIGERVEIRATVATIEILCRGERVASHHRCYAPKGTATTCEDHRPKAHRDYGKWTPERMTQWASTYGVYVERVVELMMARHVHPEMSYRACLGLLRLTERYGGERTDAACKKALATAGPLGPQRKYIEGILRSNLEGIPNSPEPTNVLPTSHAHLRGPDYFDRKESPSC
jgi:transposase